MRSTRTTLLFLIPFLCIPVLVAPMSLQQRFSCTQAIEKVYWAHQIWPGENKSPKPRFRDTVPRSAIRQKVQDSLLKSNALQSFWDRPLQGSQLQAEMDRIAEQTRNPGMLRELWAALDNDPQLISECLARPILADRLIRNWYAADQRFHGSLRNQVLRELAGRTDADALPVLSGRRTEIRYVRSDSSNVLDDPSVIGLNEAEWSEQIQRLQSVLNGRSAEALPAGRISALQEDANRFFVAAVLEQTPDSLLVAEVSWSKTPFQEWWKSARKQVAQDVAELIFSYRLPEIGGSSCVNDTWSPTPAPPLESTGHTAVWTGRYMIVWGGFHAGFLTNVGGRYEPATGTWTPISQLGAPLTKALHTAVWTGSEMIVWGGEEAGYETNAGARYNPKTDTWTPISTQFAPEPRSWHSAVWTGREMLVWGGVHYDGQTGSYLNTGGRYNPQTNTWIPLPIPALAGRTFHTTVWTGNEMILWGGSAGTRTQPVLFDDGARFNPVTNSWSPVNRFGAPAPRYGHSAVWTGRHMIVWGGLELSASSSKGTGAIYDAITKSWTPIPVTGAPEARSMHSAVWTGTEMIVWGGGSDRGSLVTGGRFNLASGTWRPISTENAPQGRVLHSTVWTGAEMIVWGGSRPSSPNTLNSGGSYDPGTDSWTPTQDYNTPSSRWYHTAVWTGTEMIVWGGVSGLKTGGKFDPALNIWTPTSTMLSPSEVYAHTAVWSGSEMIVWGGYASRTYTNQGGKYNPLTDTWSPIPVDSNTPSGRSNHSAVWTGSEMIVWGGMNDSGGNLVFYNDGGRYDPASDSWLPIFATNAPAPRKAHTAVWTGSEMIVWGGYPFTDTGGRYDPAQDAWQTTAIDPNTPSARQWHGAVWTGAEMIVWGGWSAFDYGLNTGSRYNPVANVWTPVSDINAPEARIPHAMVWTGSEMIVWSGNVLFGTIWNTGGRYRLSSDTWTATSLVDAPAPRRYHTAVWTGETVIVWGGIGGWNTGAQYCASPP